MSQTGRQVKRTTVTFDDTTREFLDICEKVKDMADGQMLTAGAE